MSIYEKILRIQQELKVPKKQYNKFGDYNYRSCEDIVESLKPHLAKEKLFMSISDTVEQVGERYYIKATVSIFDCESNKSIENTAYAREAISKPKFDEAQLTGSASSYARKYALNGLFCIDDTKDADTNEFKNEKTNRPEPVYQCQECQKVIKTVKKQNGEIIDPATIYSKCSGLCLNCYKKKENENDIQSKS